MNALVLEDACKQVQQINPPTHATGDAAYAESNVSYPLCCSCCQTPNDPVKEQISQDKFGKSYDELTGEDSRAAALCLVKAIPVAAEQMVAQCIAAATSSRMKSDEVGNADADLEALPVAVTPEEAVHQPAVSCQQALTTARKT
jgi:hypothetical protein